MAAGSLKEASGGAAIRNAEPELSFAPAMLFLVIFIPSFTFLSFPAIDAGEKNDGDEDDDEDDEEGFRSRVGIAV